MVDINNMTVLEYYKNMYAPKVGEVGIEIECEGSNFLPLSSYWTAKGDGSLRGESIEYILKAPVSRDKVHHVLTYLNKQFEKNKTVYNEGSPRTSVHVHINVQNMTWTEVTNFIILYFVYENLLINLCGNNRKGNVYCLAASDAEYLLKVLMDSIRTNNWRYLATNRIRYSAINLAALSKFGSIEFRAMRGTINTDVLDKWAKVLLCLKDSARRFKEPREIIQDLSSEGRLQFTNNVFGDLANLITDQPTFTQDVQSGIWQIQDIAFMYPVAKVKEKYVDEAEELDQLLNELIPVEENYEDEEDEEYEAEAY